VKPYTLDEAEVDLVSALSCGDRELIDSLSREVDQLAQPAPPPNFLGAALWYADQGLHTFPVQAGGKVPFPFTRGCKDATLDPNTIRAWWDKWPDANVAIATGWLVDVVDFDGQVAHRRWTEEWMDSPDADAGVSTWEEAGRFPASSWSGTGVKVIATVSTPRAGGLHVYVPQQTGMGNRADLLGGDSHVDYRGLGGYVVAPPSHTDVGSYRFLWRDPLGVLA
jgi:hypothetical protein